MHTGTASGQGAKNDEQIAKNNMDRTDSAWSATKCSITILMAAVIHGNARHERDVTKYSRKGAELTFRLRIMVEERALRASATASVGSSYSATPSALRSAAEALQLHAAGSV